MDWFVLSIFRVESCPSTPQQTLLVLEKSTHLLDLCSYLHWRRFVRESVYYRDFHTSLTHVLDTEWVGDTSSTPGYLDFSFAERLSPQPQPRD